MCLILQLFYMKPVPDSVKAFLLDEAITFVGMTKTRMSVALAWINWQFLFLK
jgi:hypothetical protein